MAVNQQRICHAGRLEVAAAHRLRAGGCEAPRRDVCRRCAPWASFKPQRAACAPNSSPEQALPHAGAGELRNGPQQMHQDAAALFCGVCDLALCLPGLLDYCQAFQGGALAGLCAILNGALAAATTRPAFSGTLELMRLQLKRVMKALVKVAATLSQWAAARCSAQP